MRDALGAVQRILLVGGSSEIGLAIVHRLAPARRARVVLAGRDLARLAEAGREVVAAGARTVDVLSFDALGPAQGEALADRAFAGEDIDVVVVAVGVLGDQAEAERDGTAAGEIVQANFAGLIPALVPLAERLRRQGHGALVVLSSLSAVRPRRANFVYGAAKAGLDAFVRGLAAMLHGSGVHVMLVRPGFVHTRMTAGRRPAPFSVGPEEVAAAVEHGLRDSRRIVWVPGRLRWVGLVLRLLPEAVVRRLQA